MGTASLKTGKEIFEDIQGPLRIEAELWYQPIGYRWANNLKPYNAAEPRRFTGYFDWMAQASAEVLARASVIP
jgi:hypothetical protein